MREPVIFWYRNHRGAEAYRRVIPIELREGTSEYYPEKQWLLRAYDLEKEAIREFALAKMAGVVGSPPLLFEGGAAEAEGVMRARDERGSSKGKTDGDTA